MLVATAMNTKGKPKAAMWEGLLPVSIAPAVAPASGWREVSADGQSTLKGEAFIAMNRFTVLPGQEGAFERRFAARESQLASYSGFKGFLLLRRDGKDDDGVTHSTWSVWEDRASFEAWRSSEKSQKRPGTAKPPEAKPPAEGAQPAAAAPPSLYARAPVPTFYEAILMLESAKGV